MNIKSGLQGETGDHSCLNKKLQVNNITVQGQHFIISQSTSLHISKTSGTLSFEILSCSCNTLSVPDQETVKTILELRDGDVSQCALDCCLEVIQRLEAMSAQLAFEDGECPIVTWRQVWTVLWVTPETLSHIHCEQICSCVNRSMGRSIILQEVKILGFPQLRAFPLQGLSELLQAVYVNIRINYLLAEVTEQWTM